MFPDTFEFFFIAYEAIRLRYDPARRSARFWLVVAVALWVLVKLPQEYWIHIAQRDFTETVAEYPWFGVLCAAGVLTLLAALGLLVRPRLPAPSWGWRLQADPLPTSLDDARLRHARHLREPRTLLGELAEQVHAAGAPVHRVR